MKVSSLHLCTSDSWGGLELYACTLMEELKKSGCEVFAICKPKSRVETFLQEHKIRFTYLPTYSTISLVSIRFLQSLIRQRDIQVLHAHFHKDIWPASLALRNDSTRKLFLSIYMGVPKKNDIFHRFIYRRVNAFFTSSQELNKRLPTLYPIPASKIYFLPYGRRIENYRFNEKKRNDIRARYGIQKDDLLIGTMVRIDPGKGVMDFAQSFLYIDEQLRSHVRYMIVGEPTRRGRVKKGESPYEPHCEEYLNDIQRFISEHKLQDRIYLAGFQDDLIGYLSAFDVFVFPSRDELYSLVVLDAMCLGLPIVAARAGGNLYQVTDGINGLLYHVADSRDLAAKLTMYCNDPQLRRQHGAAAQEFVRERHNMDNTIKALLEFYQS